MRRREFITLVGGASAAWPVATRAQPLRPSRVGLLYSASPFTDLAFRHGLGEVGFSEGRNVIFEYRWARGDYGQLPRLASELAGLPVDVIAAFGSPAAREAKIASLKSTPAIPVVFTMASDPILEGYVQSLNHPGGNITGVTSISGELMPKRLELIRELVSNEAEIGILLNPRNPLSETEQKIAEAASHAMGLRIEVLAAGDQAEIDKVFASLVRRKVGALIIASDVFYYGQMQRIAGLAAQLDMPVIGPLREFATEGGLLSYGASIPDINRQGGVMVGKILKGARPAELPVQQPTKYELVINLKTAKALGLTVPATLLARADEVIE